MLPPVSTAFNAYPTYQDARVSSDGAGAKAVVDVGTVAKTPGALQQNNEIAGRLNLLLLTGQERMAQNLTVLVDLLGSALKMERLPHETLSGYAVRLVEALGDLSPRERVALQRLLVQAFSGLQLRTLIEAFRNPAGPEAATLSIYLELYRQKDRDLAARSVVTSYRQNSGEGRGPAAAIPTAAGKVSPTAAPAPVSRSDAEIQKAVRPTPAERHAVAASVAASVAVGRAARDGVGEYPRAGRLEPAQAAPPRPTLTAVEDTRPLANQARNLDVGPHLLQAHLQEALSADTMMAAAERGPSAGLPEQAGNDAPLSTEAIEHDDNIRLPPGLRHKDLEQGAALASGHDRNPIEPDADLAASTLFPGAAGSTPAVLARNLADLLIEAAETDLLRTLLNLQIEDDNGSATTTDGIGSEPDYRMMTDQGHGVARSAPDEEAVSLALAQRIRSGGFEEQVVYAMTMPPGEPPATLFHPGLREAIPVPFVNYLIVDEFDPDPTEVEERQHAEDQAEDQADDDDEPDDDDLADDDPAGDEPVEQVAELVHEQGKEQALEGDAVEETRLLDLAERAPVLTLEDLSSERVLPKPAKQDDPAHDLYLRMSGLI